MQTTSGRSTKSRAVTGYAVYLLDLVVATLRCIKKLHIFMDHSVLWPIQLPGCRELKYYDSYALYLTTICRDAVYISAMWYSLLTTKDGSLFIKIPVTLVDGQLRTINEHMTDIQTDGMATTLCYLLTLRACFMSSWETYDDSTITMCTVYAQNISILHKPNSHQVDRYGTS